MLLINNIINKFRNTEQRIARIKEIENELVEVTTIRDAIVDSHVDISKSIESGLNEDMISRDSNFIKDLAKLKYRDRILNKELDILKGFRDIEEYDKNEKKIKARKILKSLYRSGKLSLKMYNEADSQKTDKGQVKYADVIVLNKNGELLLLKRSQWEDAHQGAWVIPGGHVDAGESYEQAAIRELREESGISVDNLRVNATIYPVNWVLGGKYSDDNASIEYYILRLTDDVELLLDEAESRDYIWIKRDEIDNYPMVFNMQTNVKKVLGWDETPQVKIIRKAIEKGIIPIDRVVDIVKAIAQIGEIRQWQDGTYRKVGNGVWEKIKGDKGRVVADSTMLTVIKKEREKYFNEYKKVEDEFIKKYKEINGDESYKISYRVRLSRVMSEDSSVKEAKDLYSVRYKELQSEINEIHSKIGDIARSKREQEHGGKKELDVESDLFNEIRDYYNIFKESENKFVEFTTANKAIPDVTVDDYWLATNAVFNMFYEYEVIEKENGIFSNNDVVGKFEDMKNSGKFEYTESPKSSSKYLVDRVNGDIYRFSDHWGRCATCYWDLIGSKKYEYGIAVCNIKEFERNDHYGFSNPKYRNSILAGAYVALDGINKILNNKGFYFDKKALLRIKGYIDNIGKSLYSTFTSHDREQLDMIKEKYKDLFEEKYLKDENINKSLNEIKGGKADKRTVEDIAKKHNVSVEFIEEQLKKGIKIEHEHTDSEEKAREIAMDHICEIKDYYDRLEKMEEEAKKDIEKAISDSSDVYIKGEINDDLFNDMNEVIDFEKGKRAVVGEIRKWQDGTYRKTFNGWELVQDDSNINKLKEEFNSSVSISKEDEHLYIEAENWRRKKEEAEINYNYLLSLLNIRKVLDSDVNKYPKISWEDFAIKRGIINESDRREGKPIFTKHTLQGITDSNLELSNSYIEDIIDTISNLNKEDVDKQTLNNIKEKILVPVKEYAKWNKILKEYRGKNYE